MLLYFYANGLGSRSVYLLSVIHFIKFTFYPLFNNSLSFKWFLDRRLLKSFWENDTMNVGNVFSVFCYIFYSVKDKRFIKTLITSSRLILYFRVCNLAMSQKGPLTSKQITNLKQVPCGLLKIFFSKCTEAFLYITLLFRELEILSNSEIFFYHITNLFSYVI